MMGVFPTRAPREMLVGPRGSIRVIRWDGGEVPKAGGAERSSIALLHGMGDSADIWRPVLRHWQSTIERTIIAIDLPGHGQSHPMPPGSYRQDLVARRIASALHDMGVLRPILVGHSRGARIALSLLGQGIEPARVVLIEMGIIDHHPYHAAIAAHIKGMAQAAPSKEELVKRCAEKLPLADPDSLREAIEAQASRDFDGWRLPTDLDALALLEEASAPDALGALRKLCSPVALIRGEFSGMLSRLNLMRLAQATNAPVTTHEVSRAGHALLIEQPKSVAQILAKAVGQR